MKRRLALYISSLAGGGAERAFVNLAQGLVKRGFTDLWLILNRVKGPYLAHLPPEVHVVDLCEPDVPFRFSRLLRYLSQQHANSPWLNGAIKTHYIALKAIGYLRKRHLQFLFLSYLMSLKLADQLRQIRPNALLSALINCNLTAILAQRFANGSKTVMSEHNTPSISLLSQSAAGTVLRMMRHLYPKADRIVAVSQGVADDLITLLNLPTEKVTVIYNPIVTPELFERSQKPINHPWLEQNRLPVILAVGRLTKQKDYPTLFRAFSLVRQVRPAKLLILGEGEERANLERLAVELGIQNDVSMPGFVDNPFAFMSKASVFVLSSAWEGFGNVLVEALACGCPVVATDCRSGPREILDNGRYGRLVPVGDHEALAKAILETLDSPDFPADRQTRIQRAMEFSVDAAVDKYLKVLLD
ncbi:Glycosyltransferase Family 4 [Candidatus Fervidibacteria bacterium JGI MDM2 SSWTFF-3-K9]